MRPVILSMIAVMAAEVLAGPATAQPTARPRGAATRPASRATPTWETSLKPADIRNTKFNAVEFLTAHVGWAVGSGEDATMIWRTTDGGFSWERLPLFDGGHVHTYRAVRFADANNGWIAGGNLLRTTDGGDTWDEVKVDASLTLDAHSLLVLAPDVVLVGGIQGWIHRTVDGGRTWSHVQIVPSTYRVVTELVAVASDAIFAVTAGEFSDPLGIYRSSDGGQSWEMVGEATKSLNALAFRDAQHGVAAGRGIAMWTTDGGDSWQRTVVPGTRHAVAWLDDQTVIAVGQSPAVIISRNGGRTWQPVAVTPSSTGELRDVAIVDPGWWFVAGAYDVNAIVRYHDPEHRGAIAQTPLTLPRPVRIGGAVYPAGDYRLSITHRDTTHVMTLALEEETPVDSARADSLTVPNGDRCADPCVAALPVVVEYQKVEERAEDAPARLRLEPTVNGFAVVLDAKLRPPRDVRFALNMLGAPAATSTTTTQAASAAAAAGRGGGSLMDRARRAASGVNPRAVSDRVKQARTSTPAVHQITLRHELDVFRLAARR